MVEVKHLTKCYGDIKAVDDISFTVETGEVLGFLGPNGAGKSTTMNMITGYISSTSGTVTIDGSEILDNPKETKKKIGYLPEIPPLYVDMTVRKYLEFMFDLKKVKLPKKEHIEEVIRLVRISEQSERIIKNLSKGYRQRVGFAQALLGNPPVLILDEPTVGLDPKQIIEIRKLIKSLGKKHTVIFSSHVLSEISATCDRIIVISNGKIVADAKPRSFQLPFLAKKSFRLKSRELLPTLFLQSRKSLPLFVQTRLRHCVTIRQNIWSNTKRALMFAVTFSAQWQESAVRFSICSRVMKPLRICSSS